jgi:D-xylose transport system substrate-binding protein
MKYVQPLIDKGDVKVVLDQAANYWNPDEALLYTEQGLTANNNDIQCVFTSNDGCAGAAIEALQEQGLAGKVPVPGLDADLAACQRIVAGTQTMTVYRKLSIMDKAAAQAAVALANGTDIAAATGIAVETKNNGKIDVPAILLKGADEMFAVDNSNMEEVVKDGWLKAADIYKDVPTEKWPAWTQNYK